MYESINMFEAMNPRYKIKKPIRLIELFAGIGSQAKALKNIDANFETYIVDTNKYEYIMTYSFPCQDLSLAGNQKGMGKGNSTRSGLLWEVERLLKGCVELPQILLMENVPQVVGKANFKDFREWEIFLEGLGYSNYFKLLNAKNYGIPQNRNRCFMVSTLGNFYYQFPCKKKLELKLKDMLEKDVDEKYFLNNKMIKYISANNEKWTGNNKKSLINKTIASVINTGEGTRRCDASNYISTNIAEENFDLKTIKYGNLYPNKQAGSIYKTEGLSPTLTTKSSENWNILILDDLKIRKLTPKECWRLMGFSDEDFEKASKLNSNSQLYKQAGNSIVVNVLEEIFKMLF